MNLLVLTSRFPYPLEKGDKLRIYHQLKYLATQHKIHLVTIDAERHDSSIFESWGITVHQYIVPIHKRLASIFTGVFKARPLQVSYFYNRSVASQIKEDLKDLEIDMAYCHLPRMATYVEQLQIDKKVIDYMDAFSLIAEKRAKNARFWERWVFKWEHKRMLAYEKKLASIFDRKILISRKEAAYFKSQHGFEADVIPNGIDLSYFAFANEGVKKYDLVFVGNMSYHPNIGAAKYLITKILPALEKVRPGLQILIAGTNPPDSLKQMASDHVAISGWLDDIRTAYYESKIMVAPISLGSGLQNKVLEAFACGTPVVCSPTVAEGISYDHEAPVKVANHTEQYVEGILSLLDDKQNHQAQKERAYKYVKQHFDWSMTNKKLNNILVSL